MVGGYNVGVFNICITIVEPNNSRAKFQKSCSILRILLYSSCNFDSKSCKKKLIWYDGEDWIPSSRAKILFFFLKISPNVSLFHLITTSLKDFWALTRSLLFQYCFTMLMKSGCHQIVSNLKGLPLWLIFFGVRLISKGLWS